MEQMRDASLDLLVDLAKPTSHDAVLDYATGAGMAGFSVAPDVATVEAADELPDMLEEGKRLAAELGLVNVAFTLVDLYALPYKDGAFTLVVCRNAFHLLPDPATALGELQRVLSPGGRIVLLDPVVDEETDKAFNEIARLREPAHRRHYRVDELDDIVQQCRPRRAPAGHPAAHDRPRLLAAGGRGSAAEGGPHPRPLQDPAGRRPGAHGRRLLRQDSSASATTSRDSGSNRRELAASPDLLARPAGRAPPPALATPHRPRRPHPDRRGARRDQRAAVACAHPVKAHHQASSMSSTLSLAGRESIHARR